MCDLSKLAIFIGRCQPLHNGHKYIIDKMIEESGIENSLVILGSKGEPNTAWNPFTVEQRHKMIKSVWPDINVTAIEDMPTNEKWMNHLSWLINWIYEGEVKEITLYCGDDSKVATLFTEYEFGNVRTVLTRDEFDIFDISGTLIRLEMLQPRKLPLILNQVPTEIYDGLQEMFDEQLNERLNRELG